MPDSPQAVLSVDVEDYFHVEAFADRIDRSQWPDFESRVEANTERILELFAAHDVHGTFFMLGWVAERFPALAGRIAGAGHEVACHSYWHRLVYSLDPEELREDTGRAKAVIEDAAGAQVRGYRAPSFSITKPARWALGVLAELGFDYDSSVFPVRHDVYGNRDAPRIPHTIPTPSGPITEYPMTTFIALGRYRLPVGGGGYLRLLPRAYTIRGMRSAVAEGIVPVVYVHPWELDTGQPRLPGRLRSRLRHYTNLGRMEERLTELLEQFRFVRFRDVTPPEREE